MSPNTLKHTPGPLKVREVAVHNGPFWGVFAPSTNPRRFNGDFIAHFDTKKDAELFAEAPAMLEALRYWLPKSLPLEGIFADSVIAAHHAQWHKARAILARLEVI